MILCSFVFEQARGQSLQSFRTDTLIDMLQGSLESFWTRMARSPLSCAGVGKMSPLGPVECADASANAPVNQYGTGACLMLMLEALARVLIAGSATTLENFSQRGGWGLLAHTVIETRVPYGA
jgi:hypothetical protein